MSIRLVLIGAAGAFLLAAAMAVAWKIHGHNQFQAGLAEAHNRALALAQGVQYERDKADAKYRGAELARAAAQRDLGGALAELRRLRGNASRTDHPGPSSRPDAAGSDWIGGFAACYEQYAQLGQDAAKWANIANGLQGYARAVLSGQERHGLK